LNPVAGDQKMAANPRIVHISSIGAVSVVEDILALLHRYYRMVAGDGEFVSQDNVIVWMPANCQAPPWDRESLLHQRTLGHDQLDRASSRFFLESKAAVWTMHSILGESGRTLGASVALLPSYDDHNQAQENDQKQHGSSGAYLHEHGVLRVHGFESPPFLAYYQPVATDKQCTHLISCALNILYGAFFAHWNLAGA
jgi:hypothetical protein